MQKYNKYWLKTPNLTKEEIIAIEKYCNYMGYTFEMNPTEFKGKYPIIRNGQRKGYVQKTKDNRLWFVYFDNREEISLLIKIASFFEKDFFNAFKKRNNQLFKRVFGIYKLSYENKNT